MISSIRKLGILATMTGLVASFTFIGVGSASAEDASADLQPSSVIGQTPPADYLHKLEALSAVQTPEQIENALESGTEGAPVEALFDTSTGEIVAAFKPEPTFTTFAISPLGPGCSTTSLCMTNSSNTYLVTLAPGSCWARGGILSELALVTAKAFSKSTGTTSPN
ncbi:hypothetical protein [Arthrobacter sp. GMC3]|uniref:hypothetical protein n=1 Tax=Arthrobacter sp. GMC3 TaxID=2058894 RepID=UPI0011B039DC|nr:hypothetical protein [Arthrobacter sp. GMC3]